jgi:ATP-dependent exoDNAse (exonuclease V) alpha subunit
LQPIEAGMPFRDLIERYGAARLSEIHRQRSAWQRHASRDLAEGRVQDAVRAYDADGAVRRSPRRDEAIIALLEDYLKDHETDGPETTKLAFAHRRKDVFALNQAIRRAVRMSNDTTKETLFETETGPRAFTAGDRIVFTRNDKEMGVRNGMLGTVEAANDDKISVRLDDDSGVSRRITFDPLRYRHFDHGYAVTIHKSQGATVERAYVLASRTMDEALTYVAMTRHRGALRLYINGEDAPAWAEKPNAPRQRKSRQMQTFDR